MSTNKKQAISALLDNELTGEDTGTLIRHLHTDESLRHVLLRYRMIGECIKGEPSAVASINIAEAVQKRLQDEPTVLAPVNRKKHRVIKVAVSTAMAASVAALAIVLGPQIMQQSKMPSESGFGTQIVVAPAESPTLITNKIGTWKTQPPEVESRLNGYLEEHDEYTAPPGMGSLRPYASFVRFDDK